MALRSERCVNIFHQTVHTTPTIHSQHMPYSITSHLERGSFACGVISVTLVMLSLVTGVLGQIFKHMTTILVTVIMPLCAGLFLLTSLILFHSKLYVLKKRDALLSSPQISVLSSEKLPQMDIPVPQQLSSTSLKEMESLVFSHRIYPVGWSLWLAWFSLLTCFMTAYLWLNRYREVRYNLGLEYCTHHVNYYEKTKHCVEPKEHLHKSMLHEISRLCPCKRKHSPTHLHHHLVQTSSTVAFSEANYDEHPVTQCGEQDHQPPRIVSRVALLLRKISNKNGKQKKCNKSMGKQMRRYMYKHVQPTDRMFEEELYEEEEEDEHEEELYTEHCDQDNFVTIFTNHHKI